MIRKMLCIECPNGCALEIDTESHEVKGNRCPRGKLYAQNELLCPMRTLTSTVKTTSSGQPVVPVRTSAPIPKKDLFKAMKAINALVAKAPLPIGSVLVKGFLGSEADLITTAPLD